MSTAGDAPTASKPYFCYECNSVVTLTPFPNSDLNCPDCNGGFLEEYQPDPNPNPINCPDCNCGFLEEYQPDPNPNPINPIPMEFPSLVLSPAFPALSFGGRGGGRRPTAFSSTTVDLRNPAFFSIPGHPELHVFNPYRFLQNYLQSLQEGGADIQFVVENHPSHPGFRLPANFGDYFLGPGLEELIQRLAENDPNRHGTPPASKKAVEGLPNVKITEELNSSDSVHCAVCMDNFVLGSEAKQMPCKHIFHSDCILPWLELHNSCPVCRYELPTDDPEYENRRGNSNSSGSNHGGGDGAGEGHQSLGTDSERPLTVGRRFMISLPWPFSFISSDAGNNNDQGSGSEDQEGSEHGQESREQG